MFDIVVVVVFLLITLVVGSIAGRNIKSISNFAIGSGRYGSITLMATLSASFIGGGYTLGISEKVFSSGIAYILCLLGFSLQQILVAKIIAPRMRKFEGAFSVGDIMAQFYGKCGRVIAGYAASIVCAGIIGAQVSAMGYVFHLFLGLEHALGIVIGCGIVIAYSIYGGMKAVIATDILQFWILIIAMPVALICGVIYVGGVAQVIAAVPETHFHIPGNMTWLAMAGLFISLLVGEALVPPYVQRLFIARDVATTKKGVLWSGLLSIPFFIIAGCLGLVAFTIDATIDANLAMPTVLQTALPMGLKGLTVAGVIAVIMSSADSYLNSAAIAVTHDIIKPLSRSLLSTNLELRIARIATLFIGVMAIFFALQIKSAMDILLYSYNFWAPIILVPLAAGILGLQIQTRQFVLCGVLSIVSVILWNSCLQSGLDGLVVGVIVNLAIFCICYKCNNNKPAEVVNEQ